MDSFTLCVAFIDPSCLLVCGADMLESHFLFWISELRFESSVFLTVETHSLPLALSFFYLILNECFHPGFDRV